jgi:protein TonB
MAAPTPPPRPAPVSAAVRENALEAYAGAVHRMVQADLKVPQMVEMMHLSGTTEIALRIAPDGRLLGARVIHSSGAPPIDRAALAAVRAAQFPDFSAKMPHHPITVDIAVKLRSQ